MTKAKNSAQRKKEAELRRMAQEAEPAKQTTATQSGSVSGPALDPAPPVAGPSHGPAQVLEAGPAAGTDPGPTGTSPDPPRDPRRGAATRPYQDAPNLEPWMRQTVVLKLKDVDGRKPDMNQGTFGKKMVLEQGFAKPEVTSISSFWSGVFFRYLCIDGDMQALLGEGQDCWSRLPFRPFCVELPHTEGREADHRFHAEPPHPGQRHHYFPPAVLHSGEGSRPHPGRERLLDKQVVCHRALAQGRIQPRRSNAPAADFFSGELFRTYLLSGHATDLPQVWLERTWSQGL